MYQGNQYNLDLYNPRQRNTRTLIHPTILLPCHIIFTSTNLLQYMTHNCIQIQWHNESRTFDDSYAFYSEQLVYCHRMVKTQVSSSWSMLWDNLWFDFPGLPQEHHDCISPLHTSFEFSRAGVILPKRPHTTCMYQQDQINVLISDISWGHQFSQIWLCSARWKLNNHMSSFIFTEPNMISVWFPLQFWKK